MFWSAIGALSLLRARSFSIFQQQNGILYMPICHCHRPFRGDEAADVELLSESAHVLTSPAILPPLTRNHCPQVSPEAFDACSSSTRPSGASALRLALARRSIPFQAKGYAAILYALHTFTTLKSDNRTGSPAIMARQDLQYFQIVRTDPQFLPRLYTSLYTNEHAPTDGAHDRTRRRSIPTRDHCTV